MDVFESPERRADGTFFVKLATPIQFSAVELEWKRGAEFPTPDLRIQQLINGFREKTLRDLTRNKVLFKTPPTLAALTALAPTWGLLLRSGAAEWNRQDSWWDGAAKKGAGSRVALMALGVIISRQSIVPVWDVEVKGALPESSVVIDLDFGGASDGEVSVEDDGVSVHSDDFVSEEGVVKLADTEQRKADAKARVRALMAVASKAKMEADDAMDRFFTEYDLSEDESDFSEDEDD
jgi:hypothetical protein